MQTPKIVERDTAHVVFVRETGEYDKSSEIAWTTLSQQLNDLGERLQECNECTDIILDRNNGELLGVCYDDPSVTQEDNIRYDAAIAWGKKEIDFLKEHGFNTKEIPGGKYATALYRGNYEKALASWMALYAWIEENGYRCRDFPPFEKYLNTPQEVSEEDLLAEIYVPVE